MRSKPRVLRRSFRGRHPILTRFCDARRQFRRCFRVGSGSDDIAVEVRELQDRFFAVVLDRDKRPADARDVQISRILLRLFRFLLVTNA